MMGITLNIIYIKSYFIKRYTNITCFCCYVITTFCILYSSTNLSMLYTSARSIRVCVQIGYDFYI